MTKVDSEVRTDGPGSLVHLTFMLAPTGELYHRQFPRQLSREPPLHGVKAHFKRMAAKG